ncbi:MAG: glycosyltransferase, partial [Candidatus Aenigmatarchaeota archaeon]
MISVVIPARNEEKNIGDLLKSIRKNNFKNYEIIVVDGKSKDRTREIARSYNCRVIVQRKLGVSNARNLGWKNAKGNIIVFLEADHIVNKNFLKEIYKTFKDKKVKCARPVVIPIKNNWIQKALAVQIELATRRQKAWEFPTIFRKEVLKEVGGYDESINFAEDRELPQRVKKAG